MSDTISKLINNIFKMSQYYYATNNPVDKKEDNKNDLLCLSLVEEGWKEDGFDYIEGSQDIITFWKKDGQIKHVHLTFRQQQNFVRELDKKNRGDKNG